jgi:predicted ABC-type ATPase
MPRKIIIIAGPHGAGKTAFAREFLSGEAACGRFINADLIAAGLSPFAPRTMLARASRLMLEEIHACARRRESFAFETTLSGLGYTHLIWQWQKAGYRVYLYFLALSSEEVAVARVAGRVKQGGHDIPEEIIRRHFAAGAHHFNERYRTIVDHWVLYDNSDEQPRFLEFGENPTRSVMKRWAATAWKYRLAEHPCAPAWRPDRHGNLNEANDADLCGSFPALQRAAAAARQTAIETHTALVVGRKKGKIVQISANRLIKQAETVGLLP